MCSEASEVWEEVLPEFDKLVTSQGRAGVGEVNSAVE
jgi:hypothetical protein